MASVSFRGLGHNKVFQRVGRNGENIGSYHQPPMKPLLRTILQTKQINSGTSERSLVIRIGTNIGKNFRVETQIDRARCRNVRGPNGWTGRRQCLGDGAILDPSPEGIKDCTARVETWPSTAVTDAGSQEESVIVVEVISVEGLGTFVVVYRSV